MTVNSTRVSPRPSRPLRRTAEATLALGLGVILAWPSGAYAVPADLATAARATGPAFSFRSAPAAVVTSVPALVAWSREGERAGRVEPVGRVGRRHCHRDRLDCVERWRARCEGMSPDRVGARPRGDDGLRQGVRRNRPPGADLRRPRFRERESHRSWPWSSWDDLRRPRFRDRDLRSPREQDPGRPWARDRDARRPRFRDRDLRWPRSRERDSRWPGFQDRDARRPRVQDDARRPRVRDDLRRPRVRDRDLRWPRSRERDSRWPGVRDRNARRPWARDRDARRPRFRDDARRPRFRDRDLQRDGDLQWPRLPQADPDGAGARERAARG
ncbi:hypothetical protein GCM10017673_18470 [Streptosporangium violaceochromogenes]|nr:hypothetical protein GCM10017673_18470 [Streptosporangium violaceochromogenes]